ncbi:MAG: hypothetical protein WC460_03690 [Patescibacteria group bacterium]
MRNVSEKQANRIWKLQTQIGKGLMDGTHDPEKFADSLQKFLGKKDEILQGARAILELESYRLFINSDQTMAEMIKKGKYSSFDEDINNEHFKIQHTRQHEVELELVHFRFAHYGITGIHKKIVLAHLIEEGLKPAKIVHLLFLCALYPELQRPWITALGSEWVNSKGRRLSPYLKCFDNQRELKLNWGGDGFHWKADTCFLAVRE